MLCPRARVASKREPLYRQAEPHGRHSQPETGNESIPSRRLGTRETGNEKKTSAYLAVLLIFSALCASGVVRHLIKRHHTTNRFALVHQIKSIIDVLNGHHMGN